MATVRRESVWRLVSTSILLWIHRKRYKEDKKHGNPKVESSVGRSCPSPSRRTAAAWTATSIRTTAAGSPSGAARNLNLTPESDSLGPIYPRREAAPADRQQITRSRFSRPSLHGDPPNSVCGERRSHERAAAQAPVLRRDDVHPWGEDASCCTRRDDDGCVSTSSTDMRRRGGAGSHYRQRTPRTTRRTRAGRPGVSTPRAGCADGPPREQRTLTVRL